jgi:hypothetical protein
MEFKVKRKFIQILTSSWLYSNKSLFIMRRGLQKGLLKINFLQLISNMHYFNLDYY